jgi:hypothetical protein
MLLESIRIFLRLVARCFLHPFAVNSVTSNGTLLSRLEDELYGDTEQSISEGQYLLESLTQKERINRSIDPLGHTIPIPIDSG